MDVSVSDGSGQIIRTGNKPKKQTKHLGQTLISPLNRWSGFFNDLSRPTPPPIQERFLIEHITRVDLSFGLDSVRGICNVYSTSLLVRRNRLTEPILILRLVTTDAMNGVGSSKDLSPPRLTNQLTLLAISSSSPTSTSLRGSAKRLGQPIFSRSSPICTPLLPTSSVARLIEDEGWERFIEGFITHFVIFLRRSFVVSPIMDLVFSH